MQLDSTATAHLQTLRDRSTGLAEFRVAAHALIPVLFRELQAALKQRSVAEETVVFAIVLRAALVFLPEAVRSFPSSPVAFAGLRRDEKTAIAHWYYENVPEITKKHTLVILDPMLATGGSAEESALNLLKRGADPQKIWFLGFLAAPEGINRLTKHIPSDQIIVAAVDEGLDDRKFIVPGLGDFGDRYFGTPL
ncbi:MAG TPA: uracil phosphoribosyltransferase [Candidatus Peribacteraceae bacterium]|nr:uracil phosphoribosyltransferase [Candidatus Peribacteraceae bacterium]